MKKRLVYGLELILLVGLSGCGQINKSMTEEVESPGSYETSASYEAETSYNATNIPEDAEVRIFESEGKQVITVNGVLVTDPEVKTLKNDGTDPDPEKYFSESE